MRPIRRDRQLAAAHTEGGPDAAVVLRGVSKTFNSLDAPVVAADGIDLDIAAGSITAIVGPSGGGKSTLLHLIGGLDHPDEGDIDVFGTRITQVPLRKLSSYRRHVGFVFQRFNLLPTLTVLDNVLAPTVPFGTTKDIRQRAHELLDSVGLSDREDTLATRLSGGQQQRVAIARALIAQPRLVLADEPTGNLDSVTGEEIIELLFALRDTHAVTLILATHDPDLAARCDRVIHVRDGRVLG